MKRILLFIALFHLAIAPVAFANSPVPKVTVVAARISADVDRPAIPIKQSTPVYPKSLLDFRIIGEATVDFVVTASGDVTEVHATFPKPYPYMKDFSEATRHAVTSWKFEPARKGGKVVACRRSFLILFDLPEE